MSPSLDTRENRDAAAEVKFLISPAVADQIHAWASARLQPDPNATTGSPGRYRITSLYFDTKSFDVFHRRGSFGRAKFRIRRYGTGEVAFLERKLRTKKMLTKRRSIVKLNELGRLDGAEPELGWAGCWFHGRILTRGLKPVCEVTYLRSAREAMTNRGPIRLTLDEDLRATPAEGLSFSGKPGETMLPGSIILELKFCFEMPGLFKNLVQEFGLSPQALSKYRTAAGALNLVPDAATPLNNALSPRYA